MAHRRVCVGISGSYGGLNLGDEAILHSIISALRREGDIELTVYSLNADDTLQRHAVDRAIGIRDLSRDEAREELRRLDLFILGGGGILFDGAAEAFLREVTLACELGIPIVVYAIGAGPLVAEAKRELVRDCLTNAALVTVRDRQAQHLLEEIGITREIVVTADPALLLESAPFPADALTREGLDASHRLVGFSVREPGPAAPEIDAAHYHALLANAADFVVDRFDADVVFVPMERKQLDLQQSHAVLSRMQFPQRATVLRGDYSPPQILALVARFSFAVGMRLHFLIFAALQGVPFVALPYASKVHGLLQDLGMEMPPLDKVTPGHLLAYIDRSWDQREATTALIRERLPALRDRARMTHELVMRIMEERFPPDSRRMSSDAAAHAPR